MRPFPWPHRICVLLMTFGLIGTSCVATKKTDLAKQEKQFHQQSAKVSAAKEPDPAVRTKGQALYSQLPLHFEVNQGQSDAQVKFLSRGHGYTLFLAPTEAVLALRNAERGMRNDELKNPHSSFHDHHSSFDTGTGLRMQLIGANLQPQVEGIEELPGKINYFIGDDPVQWRTHIPTYAKVKYHNVYPGVDLVYYGNQRQLEYDFVVAPGVDPRVIQLSLTDLAGQQLPAEITATGDLLVRVADSTVHMRKPLLY
jgi:hypothetical protein